VILPPLGYLKRLREICTKHDILLIFDEVITASAAWASVRRHRVRVTPDLMTTAKGLTNGAIPWAPCSPAQDLRRVHAGPRERHRAVPRLHLFGAPAACAASLATLDIYAKKGC